MNSGLKGLSAQSCKWTQVRAGRGGRQLRTSRDVGDGPGGPRAWRGRMGTQAGGGRHWPGWGAVAGRGRWGRPEAGVPSGAGVCGGPSPLPAAATSLAQPSSCGRGGAFLRRRSSPSGSLGFSELSPPLLRTTSSRPIPGPQPNAHQTTTCGLWGGGVLPVPQGVEAVGEVAGLRQGHASRCNHFRAGKTEFQRYADLLQAVPGSLERRRGP